MQGWRATWDLVLVVAPYRNGWELPALGFLLEFGEKAMNVREEHWHWEIHRRTAILTTVTRHGRPRSGGDAGHRRADGGFL
jgi:hypothetical protein